MKAVDSMWYSSLRGYFGFVLAEDEITNERAIFAGVVAGHNQKEDEKAILDWGSRVNISILKGMLAKLEVES